jgi:hypothetical protein
MPWSLVMGGPPRSFARGLAAGRSQAGPNRALQPASGATDKEKRAARAACRFCLVGRQPGSKPHERGVAKPEVEHPLPQRQRIHLLLVVPANSL